MVVTGRGSLRRTKQYHWRLRRTWRMDVSEMDWGSACHAVACEVSARRGILRRTHPVLAKKCSALEGKRFLRWVGDGGKG